MTARILDGKLIASRERERVKARAAELAATGVTPGLAVVLVGDDPASRVYVKSKTKAAAECGVAAFDHSMPESTPERDLLDLVDRLNSDPRVDGILVQLPLPKHIDSRRVIHAIAPRKDVDGFHPENVGLLTLGTPRFVACTPKGCMVLLAESGVSLRGARAIVVGRSNIVGKPMASLLTHSDCTVTVAHSRTRDLPEEVSRADIVVAAIGKPEAIKGEWIKPGAVVIDVGINRTPAGKLVGDVEFGTAATRASAITPVPGGVGPMTIAMLLSNTIDSACARAARG